MARTLSMRADDLEVIRVQVKSLQQRIAVVEAAEERLEAELRALREEQAKLDERLEKMAESLDGVVKP